MITYTKGLGTPQIALNSTGTGVEISWGAVDGAEGYYVYRRETSGTYTRIKTLSGSTTTSYVDTTAVDGTSYYYAVRAYSGTTLSGFEGKAITYVK